MAKHEVVVGSSKKVYFNQKMMHHYRMASRYSAEIEKGVESLIHCLICTEPYKDPRVLPCQHTFCRDCLQRYHDNFNTQRIIKASNFPCPSCRKTCYLPQGEVINLPKDFKVGQISDFFDKINITSRSSRGESTCDVCRYDNKIKASSSFCVQCSKYLCETCTTQHGDSVLFKGHSTMKVDSPDLSILECQEHNEEIKYYCRPCAAALCTVCALSKHSKHDVSDISSALEQQRLTIQESVAKLRQYIIEYQNKAENLAKLRKERGRNIEACKQTLKLHMKECIKKLEDEEERLSTEMDHNLCAITEQIRGEEKAIQVTVDSIQSLCDSAEALTQQDQSIQLLATSNSMQKNLNEIIAKPCQPIKPEIRQTMSFRPALEFNIGILALNDPPLAISNDTADSDSEVSGTKAKKSKHMSGIKMTIHNPLTRSMSTNSPEMRKRYQRMGSCPPVPLSTCKEGQKTLWKTNDDSETRDIVFMPDGSAACTEHKLGTNKLQIYDVTGKLLRALDSNGSSQLVKPWGISVNIHAATIAVTDHGDSSIKFLDTDLRVCQTWKRLFEKPCGIAVMRSGEYVITDVGDRYLQKISIYLPNGIRIRDFGSKGTEQGQFLQPNYVAVDHHDRIVVSDSKLHCVKVLDPTGKQLFKFASCNNNNPMVPQGVAVDPRNNIIIADQSTKRIMMYSPDGMFIQNIVDLEDEPWGISIHDTGLLGVASDPGLQVFQVPLFKRP